MTSLGRIVFGGSWRTNIERAGGVRRIIRGGREVVTIYGCRRSFGSVIGTATTRTKTRTRKLESERETIGSLDGPYGIGGNDTRTRATNRYSTSSRPSPSPSPSPSLSTNFRSQMRRVTHPVTIITSSDPSSSHKDDSDIDPRTYRGATVSSFNSVTVDPHPFVSFNIKRLSSTYDAIRASGLFAVHLLGEGKGAVDVATRFARGNVDGLFFVEEEGEEGNRENDTIGARGGNQGSRLKLRPHILDNTERSKQTMGNAQTKWIEGKSEKIPKSLLPPLLRADYSPDEKLVDRTQEKEGGKDSASTILFIMLCEYQPSKTINVGDHVVVIGKVLDVSNMTSTESSEEETTGDDDDNNQQKCLTYHHGRYSFGA